MRRRDLLLLSTPAVLVFIGRPEFSQAADQVYRVGVLAPEGMRAIEIFRERLAQLGWIEGRNIRFDYRSTGGDDTRQSALAAELVTLPVDLILTWGNSGDARGKAGDVDDPDCHGFHRRPSYRWRGLQSGSPRRERYRICVAGLLDRGKTVRAAA